jgi:hypothetical protein
MKRFLVFLMLLGLTGAGISQVKIKLQGGVNFSTLTEQPEGLEISTIPGYQFGGSLQIGNTVYLEPGFFWLRMGSELTTLTLEEIFEDEVFIHAFHIPALLGYQFGASNPVTFRVYAGPAMTIISSVNNDGITIDINGTPVLIKLEKEDLNSPLWGGIAGVGADFSILSLDINYELGFTKVFKENLDSKNNVIRINAGLKL